MIAKDLDKLSTDELRSTRKYCSRLIRFIDLRLEAAGEIKRQKKLTDTEILVKIKDAKNLKDALDNVYGKTPKGKGHSGVRYNRVKKVMDLFDLEFEDSKK